MFAAFAAFLIIDAILASRKMRRYVESLRTAELEENRPEHDAPSEPDKSEFFETVCHHCGTNVSFPNCAFIGISCAPGCGQMNPAPKRTLWRF